MGFSEVQLQAPTFSSFCTAEEAKARYHCRTHLFPVTQPCCCSASESLLQETLLTCWSHWLANLCYLSSGSSPVFPHLSWLPLALLLVPSAGAEGFSELSFMSCLSHEEASSLRCLLAPVDQGRVCWKSRKLKFSRNNWSIVMIFYKASMEDE